MNDFDRLRTSWRGYPQLAETTGLPADVVAGGHPYELPPDAGDELQIAKAQVALSNLGVDIVTTNLPLSSTENPPGDGVFYV